MLNGLAFGRSGVKCRHAMAGPWAGARAGAEDRCCTGCERNQLSVGAALTLDESIGSRAGRDQSPVVVYAVPPKQDPIEPQISRIHDTITGGVER
jgi:hypothetical protein